MEKSKSSKSTTSKKANTGKKSTREKTPSVKQRMGSNKESVEPKSKPTGNDSLEKEKISTEERLKKVGDRLSDAADKGVDILKDVFGKVKDFSVDAAELTRLKVEIYRLKNERERLLIVIGEKLWEIKDQEKFKDIKPLFLEDFKRLEELDTAIQNKEKSASKLSI